MTQLNFANSAAYALVMLLSSCVSVQRLDPAPTRSLAGALAHPSQAWVQVGPDQLLIARAITKDETCPKLIADGNSLQMQLRVESSEDQGAKVCELPIARSVKKLFLGEIELPLLKKDPEKILVVGDTGCKIVKKKKSTAVQDCSDPKQWPFAQIALSASKWKPDIVIHVGDYHYRESACPAGDTRCAGSTGGDNLPSWQDDFFNPAQPLLLSAPWVFVRGNHELCARAGNGWFKYLDPRKFTGACIDRTEPYWSQIGDHFIAVIDSADDQNIQTSLNSLQLQQSTESLLWMFLHRPFLTLGADDETTTKTAKLPTHLINKFSTVFTGHQHHLSLNQFLDSRPLELITGNGGTELEKPPKEIASEDVYRSYAGFGFLTLERIDLNSWSVIAHEVSGEKVLGCVLTEKSGSKSVLRCDP